jgi:hypothetical protein
MKHVYTHVTYDDWKSTNREDERLETCGTTNPSYVRNPCKKSLLCGKLDFHLGDCDMTEPLELVRTKGTASGREPSS